MTPLQDAIVKIVLEENASAAVDADAGLDRAFSDIGIDSLGAMAVMLKVMERYDIKIPDSEVDKLRTPNLLARFVEGELTRLGRST